jgi:hypothetical protein
MALRVLFRYSCMTFGENVCFAFRLIKSHREFFPPRVVLVQVSLTAIDFESIQVNGKHEMKWFYLNKS